MLREWQLAGPAIGHYLPPWHFTEWRRVGSLLAVLRWRNGHLKKSFTAIIIVTNRHSRYLLRDKCLPIHLFYISFRSHRLNVCPLFSGVLFSDSGKTDTEMLSTQLSVRNWMVIVSYSLSYHLKIKNNLKQNSILTACLFGALSPLANLPAIFVTVQLLLRRGARWGVREAGWKHEWRVTSQRLP